MCSQSTQPQFPKTNKSEEPQQTGFKKPDSLPALAITEHSGNTENSLMKSFMPKVCIGHIKNWPKLELG